ncbi:MAG: GntR family transcriptional regulator [Acidobacteria bacterium]|nr:GntR family transcriptional regulator [Acidobacteriota bacterium]MCI0719668.1 GntR family transcriptional regulator [Acidobacteriota bacterium]
MEIEVLELFSPKAETSVVRAEPLWKMVADRLRQEIFTGKKLPGQRLIETRVAKELGVAQSSVREALHHLEKEGLTTRIQNIGCCVTDPSEVQVEQMYVLRAEMEGFAVELLGKRNNKEDIRVLDEQLTSFEKILTEGDPLEFMMADLRFHHTIWERSGNEFLSSCLSRIVIPLFAFWARNFLPYFSKEQQAQSHAKHERVVDLLRTGENLTARRYMKSIVIETWMHTLELTEKK